MKNKIILTGNYGVGKTAIRRYLLSEDFAETYKPSIGVYVDKVSLSAKEDTLIIWDLPGEVKQNKIPSSHFLGSQFVIYIVDLTRPSTYVNIHKDISYLESILPDIPILTIGNKIDLINTSQLFFINSKISLDLFTSAKTGKNISYILSLPSLKSKMMAI